MSKIGRVPIKIPSGVTVTIQGPNIQAKGPKGTLSLVLSHSVKVEAVGEELRVARQGDSKLARAAHGTTHRLLQNLIRGVTDGFERRLIIEGIGFKAAVQGQTLVLELGYANPVELAIPTGIEVKVEKSLISVRGLDKQQVGEFAAIIRKQRPPDAYKGKGIRYELEVLKLKPGKKAAVAAT